MCELRFTEKRRRRLYISLTSTFAGEANGLESSVNVMFIHVTYNHGRGMTFYFV